MSDFSHLDQKYFIDGHVFNCPYCNRRNVAYKIKWEFTFDWSNSKKCYWFQVECSSCKKMSLHLSFTENIVYYSWYGYHVPEEIEDIDSCIFYSVPTSFFVIDERIPRIIRELITEAEGCLKMNFLTWASACARKAIYELTVIEKCIEWSYEEKIKSLKEKYPQTDWEYFDILSHIQSVTSDKVHEQSWERWDNTNIKLIIETLKAVLFDIYVLPEIKKDRSLQVKKLMHEVKSSSKISA